MCKVNTFKGQSLTCRRNYRQYYRQTFIYVCKQRTIEVMMHYTSGKIKSVKIREYTGALYNYITFSKLRFSNNSNSSYLLLYET